MNISSRVENTGLLICQQLKNDRSRHQKTRFKIAETISEFEGAFRLVHDVYVKEGYMDPQDSGLRVTPFSFLSTNKTFIGCKKNKVILTVTFFGDSSYGLPMDSLYKEELDILRNEGRKIYEVGALAVMAIEKLKFQRIVMTLFKVSLQYAWRHLDVDDLVIVINPKHRSFYEKVFSFRQIGTEKSYDYVKGNPAIALRLDLKWDKKRFLRMNQLSGDEEKLDEVI